ncbi:mobilization protein (MobL-like), partial [Acinetobacter lactucae]|nr:mobilization protein (MobL-like) [Acinetobacter lactucae]
MLSWFSRRAHLAIGFHPMVRQGVNPLCNPQTNIFMLVISINRNKEQNKMAIYHFSVKTISRGNGRSAVACAAYRSGEKLVCNFYGKEQDY